MIYFNFDRFYKYFLGTIFYDAVYKKEQKYIEDILAYLEDEVAKKYAKHFILMYIIKANRNRCAYYICSTISIAIPLLLTIL